jgi:hypothetical protein
MEILANYKNLIYEQSNNMTDFMCLLMKQRNAKGKWTPEELQQIRIHLKMLFAFVPFLIVFLLPFGFALLPVLAKTLDRRKGTRNS